MDKNFTKLGFMRTTMMLLAMLLCSVTGAKAEETLTVYEGTATNDHVPAFIFYFDNFTRSQFVIPAADLAAMNGKEIISIKFYTTSDNVPYTPGSIVDVYLKEVNYTSISAFEIKEVKDIVYKGQLSVVSAGSGGELTINLTTPFDYAGGNLLIGIENTTRNDYKEFLFYGQNVTGASISGFNDSSLANVTTTQQSFIPKTTFTYFRTGPTALKITEISSNSATLSWSENGTASAWQICLNNDENNLIDANTNPFTLTGLDVETAYNVKVRSYYSDTDQSEWSKTLTFTTEATYPAPTNVTANNLTKNTATISWEGKANTDSYHVKYKQATVSGTTLEAVFSDSFENGLDNWTTYTNGDNHSDLNWHQYDGNIIQDCSNHSGNYGVISRSWSSSTGDRSVDNWLVTPQMTLGDVVKFWVCGDDANWQEYYAVYVSTKTNETSDFELVEVPELAPGDGTWAERIVDLSAYAGQTGYIAIRHTDTAKDFLLIDDFGVYNTVNTYSYGTEHTINTTEKSCNLTGLSEETMYEVNVQADYGSDNTSRWSTIYFTTPDACSAPTSLVASNITATKATLNWADTQDSYNIRYREVYFYEDFEGESLPTGWTAIDANSDGNTWSIGHATTHSGDNGAYNLSYIYGVSGTTSNDYLVSPLLDLQGTLRVWLSGFGDSYAEHFEILLSTTGNSTADFTTTLVGETTTSNEYVEYTADLSNYAGQQGYIAIHHFNCTDQRYLYVDDFGLYGNEDWVLMSGINEATTTLTGLRPNTGYEWQVQGLNCDGNGGTTDWSEVAKFTTNTPTPIELANNSNNSQTINDYNGETVDVTLQGRTLYKDGSWNTLCLPFNVTESAITNSTHPLYGATAMHLDKSNWYDSEGHASSYYSEGLHRTGEVDADGTLYLYFKPAANNGVMTGAQFTAGYPFIVKWDKPDGYDDNPSAFDIANPIFSGVKISSTTPIDVVSEEGSGNITFCGTYSPVGLAVNDKTNLFLGDENRLYWPNGTNYENFPNVNGASSSYYYLGACRAYFRLGGNAVNAHSFSLSFGEGETTGIRSLTPDHSPNGERSGYYTLDGRKLSGKPTQKGVYIVNGKKRVIK